MTARYYGLSGATKVYYGSTLVWSGGSPSYRDKYFTIEFIEDGTFALNYSDIEYRKNGGNWESGTTTVSVESGDTVECRGDRTTVNGVLLSTSGKFNVYGNIMSLTHSTNFENAQQAQSYEHNSLLKETKVVNAENLIFPDVKLTDRGIEDFFRGCYYLTTAPKEILATTLGTGCMSHTFQGCSAMTTTPLLYASVFTNSSINGMFESCKNITSLEFVNTIQSITNYAAYYCCSGCINLSRIKVNLDSSITNVSRAFGNWVANVSSTGTFITNEPSLWPSGTSGIPEGWTIIQD